VEKVNDEGWRWWCAYDGRRFDTREDAMRYTQVQLRRRTRDQIATLATPFEAAGKSMAKLQKSLEGLVHRGGRSSPLAALDAQVEAVCRVGRGEAAMVA
jgi:hypothetical protein